jgi:putative ABC transport system permease protein
VSPSRRERLQYFERLRATVAKLPGVIDASATQDTLVVGDFYGTAQLKMKDGSYRPVMGGFVPADLQQTAGLTMVRGRWLSGKRGAAEAVINETMARERFGDDDPVGQSFTLQVSGDRPYLVVGVVRDIRQRVRLKAGMQFYTPDWMYPPNVSSLLLRLAEDPPKEFVPVIRRAVYAFDPNLIVVHVASLHELVASTMEAERTTYTLLRGLAAIALGLAVVGLFSVIAYTVQARTREFGLRLALGATPGNLHRLVLRRGVVTAALGILVGVAGALLLTRFMQSLLFETAPYDPVVYLAVAGLLLLATLLACWLPARRAAKVEPMVALRAD